MNKDYKLVEKYWKACQDIADAFMDKYYSDSVDVDWGWVGGEIGGVINTNDDFWDFNDLVIALTKDAPEDKLFMWHSEALDHFQDKTPFMNLRTYLKTQ